MTAEHAVFVQMERVGLLRGFSGQLRRAIEAAANALAVNDKQYAERILRDALKLPNPDQP